MIRVVREPKPEVLVSKCAGWTEKLLRATTKKEVASAESKYRHPKIKEALIRMFHGKCAYCESKITHIDFGHIEHYRPKSRFKNQTFEWDNLLLACGVCNSTKYKGDKFPEASEGGPPINPCDDDPREHFDFVFIKETKLAFVIAKTKRGTSTEELFGLNRKELLEYRSKQVCKLFALSLFAETDPLARDLLLEAKTNGAEYSAFAVLCVS